MLHGKALPGSTRLRPNVPVAIQVANQLRGLLRREYVDGGRLPGENALATQLGVSRGTLRQALSILQQEGLISRHQGLGTFANRPVLGIPARIDFAYEFSELIHASGYESDVKLLEKSRVAADADTARRLQIEPGAPLLRLRKLFLAGGQPAIYVDYVLPIAVIGDDYDPAELEQPPWRFLLRRYNRQMKYVVSELEPIVAEGELAELLGVAAGSPTLKFIEISYSSKNEPLVFANVFFRHPIIRFHALQKVATLA